MAARLPLDAARQDRAVDLAFVQVLRLALRGAARDASAAAWLRTRHDDDALLRARGRIERLVADEPSRTLEDARTLVVAALAGADLSRTA